MKRRNGSHRRVTSLNWLPHSVHLLKANMRFSKRLFGALAASLALNAQAAPTDWKSYLCRYGKDAASERVQLIKVNEKDARVMVKDRDVAPKFSATHISFDGPPEVFWSFAKADGKLTVLGPYGAMYGNCRIVDD